MRIIKLEMKITLGGINNRIKSTEKNSKLEDSNRNYSKTMHKQKKDPPKWIKPQLPVRKYHTDQYTCNWSTRRKGKGRKTYLLNNHHKFSKFCEKYKSPDARTLRNYEQNKLKEKHT